MRKIVGFAKTKNVQYLILVIFLFLFPPIAANEYFLRIVVSVFLLAILALSLNIIYGYTGQLSFGHVAFYCIGAYTSTLLVMKLGLSFWLSLPLSGVMAALWSIPIGYVSLRFKGFVFAIVTFAFSEVVVIIASIWESLTRGDYGIAGIPRPDTIKIGNLHLSFESSTYFYLLTLVVTIIIVIIIKWLVNSDIGRVFVTIRENETLAASVGIDVMKYKMLSFAISALFAGLAGSLYAIFMQFIIPSSFTFLVSLDSLLAVILGGCGTMVGPVLGAILLIGIPEYLHVVQAYRLIIFGILLTLFVILMPQGIMGLVRKFRPSPGFN